MRVRSPRPLVVLALLLSIAPALSWAQAPRPSVSMIPAEITGRILRRDGTPVPNAEVTAFIERRELGFSSPDRVVTVASGPGGGFRIPVPVEPAQRFRLKIKGAGLPVFATRLHTGPPPKPLEVVTPAEPRWIAGRVLGPSGQPFGFGSVGAFSRDLGHGFTILRSSVRPDGTFTLGPLGEGSYALFHELYEYDMKSSTTPAAAEARPLAQAGEHPVILKTSHEKAPFLKLRVVDPQGRPMERFTLDIMSDWRGQGWRFGTFEVEPIEGMAPGIFRLDDAHPAAYGVIVRSDNASGWVDFKAQDNGQGDLGTVPIVLVPRPPVAFRVLNADGRPAAGIMLTIEPTSHPPLPTDKPAPRLKLTPWTDAAGIARCGCLMPVSYCVRIDGDEKMHLETQLDFTPQADAPTTVTITRKVKPELAIAGGRVVDEKGQPLEGAVITVMRFWTDPHFGFNDRNYIPYSMTTDRNGEWTRRDSPPFDPQAKYPVRVAHPRRGPALFRDLSLQNLQNTSLTLHPSLGLLVELVTSDTSQSAALAESYLDLTLTPKPAPAGANERDAYAWDKGKMIARATEALAIRITSSTYYFPQLLRSTALDLKCHTSPWRIEQPIVLLENEREVGRGGRVTLPATGDPGWILRVPVTHTELKPPAPSATPAPPERREPVRPVQPEPPGRIEPEPFAPQRPTPKVQDGAFLLLRLVDSRGIPFAGGITIVEGDNLRPVAVMRLDDEARAAGMIALPKWRTGMTRLYFRDAQGRIEPLRLLDPRQIPGVRAAQDERGRPCLEVDFDRPAPPSRFGPITVQLTARLPILPEATARDLR